LAVAIAQPGFIDIVEQNTHIGKLAGPIEFVNTFNKGFGRIILPQHKHGMVYKLGDHKGIGNQREWRGIDNNKIKILLSGFDKTFEPIGQQ